MKPILAIALAISIAGNAWQLYHAGKATGTCAGTVDRASDANAGALATIDALKQSNAECYAGRIFDRAAASKALADREASRAKADADYRKARAELAGRLASECRDWAAQPACGVVP